VVWLATLPCEFAVRLPRGVLLSVNSPPTLRAAPLATGSRARLGALRDRLHHRLAAELPGRVHLNGPETARLPNTLNISIDGISGHELLGAITAVAASAGSACHSGDHQPSPVLTAMGVPADRGLGALRLSLGRWTTAEQIDQAVRHIVKAASACPTS
jgi:cysteine desulfurase